jgi:hypothetical protein
LKGNTMATLTVAQAVEAGLITALVAADVAGDEFTNDTSERTFLAVRNDDASATTVTITADNASTTVDGFGAVTKADGGGSVAASDLTIFGPFPTGAFNDATGKVQVTYSSITSLFVQAIRV